MVVENTLTDQDVETLQKGATGAGTLVALSDRSFFDSFKEAGALARYLAEARANSSSEVVKRVAQTRGTGFGLTAAPEEIERETLAALKDARQILETKAPDELEQYRTFVLSLARSVASAAGGGEDSEAAAVQRIERALA
jgi:hypothetical protein